MKLGEAINRLDYLFEKHRSHLVFEDREAIALGIEAMKRIKECRLADYMIREDLLPGETD